MLGSILSQLGHNAPWVMVIQNRNLSGRNLMMEVSLAYWFVRTEGDVAQLLQKAGGESLVGVLRQSHHAGHRQDPK